MSNRVEKRMSWRRRAFVLEEGDWAGGKRQYSKQSKKNLVATGDVVQVEREMRRGLADCMDLLFHVF